MVQVKAEMTLNISITASIAETTDFIAIVKRLIADGNLQAYPEGRKVVVCLSDALQGVNKAVPVQAQTQA
jgi:hypothetical protein